MHKKECKYVDQRTQAITKEAQSEDEPAACAPMVPRVRAERTSEVETSILADVLTRRRLKQGRWRKVD